MIKYMLLSINNMPVCNVDDEFEKSLSVGFGFLTLLLSHESETFNQL